VIGLDLDASGVVRSAAGAVVYRDHKISAEGAIEFLRRKRMEAFQRAKHCSKQSRRNDVIEWLIFGWVIEQLDRDPGAHAKP